MRHPDSHSRARAPLLLAILLIALVALSVAGNSLFGRAPAAPGAPAAPSVEVAPIPPMTEAIRAQIAASNGFQYFVSYGERGFEPVELSLAAGETVRFANNSSGELWIAADAERGAIYPGTGAECGQSRLDTCRVLKPHEFWEFTFVSAGDWGFRNVLRAEHGGTARVR